MYSQTLYELIKPIKINTINRLNKSKKWQYGYNKEHDVVIISKNGTIGDIYEFNKNKWEVTDYPKELKRIKTIFDWREYPEDFKKKYIDYIEKEFSKRDEGFWFYNKNVATYITGTHYMYLQWSKIDVGNPDFREANRLFYIFWEACKADKRSYGMCYLKNRRSGFSFMASGETVNQATISSDARFGILSKSGPDAKKMFTDKVVPISVNYPFFFKPIQDGMDRPKTELAYRVPASKLTRRNITSTGDRPEELTGLDTTIDWKNTGDNSYDGEKLKLLVHDESGKWERPNNILNNWRVTKTTLRLGSRIIGKCMMGSTSNALDKGGDNFKKLYNDSDVNKRNRNGQTNSGLYSLFIPMEWNYEGFIDEYGIPVFDTPEEEVKGPYGDYIDIGVVDHWQNEADGLKNDQDALNEFYRQFPRTTEHAFRDETKNSIFNLVRIYEQIDFNEETDQGISTGNFQWVNGVKDSTVIFYPNAKGRFKITWTPPLHLQNNIKLKNHLKFPGNEHMGALGCDSYDYSMNRPDKTWNKLSVAEKEIGGIPNSSEDIKQAHAAAIEMYIQSNVGKKQDGSHGSLYFTETLNDWAKFDINNRTKFDATISSGLAIMACNRHLYNPNAKVEKQKLNINFARYKQSGMRSTIIEN